MKQAGISRRFVTRGVFWRQLLHWAVNNIPLYLQPMMAFTWSLIFFLAATRERRASIHNLGAIISGSSSFANFFRSFFVFWDFASTITDTARFKAHGEMVDWEFEGIRHFDVLKDAAQGAIILTAHMGNYDLGAYLFVERIKRPMTVIRAPEIDPATQKWEQENRRQVASDDFRIDFNTESGMLALDLIAALKEHKIVAIQGDRVTPGISTFRSTLFGRPILLPSGPFALAMATKTAIHPLFVLRTGWMQYRVVTTEPFQCERTGRDRDRDLGHAIERWRSVLESVIAKHWSKWHLFDRFDEAEARES